MSKYQSSNYQINHRRSNKQSGWLSDLCRVCADGDTYNWFKKQTITKVDSRNRNKFWEEKWVGEARLKERFERLLSILNDKDKRIKQLGD